MAVQQLRSSEQRAWPQGRALLRRTALAVSSTWRDCEPIPASDAHNALDGEAGRRAPATATSGGNGNVRGDCHATCVHKGGADGCFCASSRGTAVSRPWRTRTAAAVRTRRPASST
ncbi:uncharacterized protein LOC119325689 [Triticum dicoccoides]|uniref:uncharacterized protein LOC119325689 n=1 Tax=Triticum dicoccoides TaxID=85692 RepID=UPI0018918D15|nr:uncharacterized protein LOC119325689 [Triticum dicoccoides]